MLLLLAELRKILTIRAFYVIMAFIFILPIGLMSFYIYGIRDVSRGAENAMVLMNVMNNAAGLIATLLAFVAVLNVGHEYRYNTILYAFTGINSRLKVVMAKLIVLLGLGIAVTVFGVLLSTAAFYLGQNIHGVSTVAQSMPEPLMYIRMLAAVLATIALAYFITFLVRSFAFAIAFVLIVPSTVEPLLTLVIKENTKYLPYTSISNLTAINSTVPYGTSAMVVAAYFVGLLVLTGLLVNRRDAN